MTIDEAIEYNAETLRLYEKHLLSWQRDALKLGIEALKAVKNARANNYYTPIDTMPGETKD